MKVLFISNGQPDYQCDCVFLGLYELLGADFTHSCDYDLMYKDRVPSDSLLRSSGRGFTIWNNLPEYLNDKSDLEHKIKSKYFDLIIYGHFRRCLDYYELVTQSYDKNQIILIDGEDDQYIGDTQGHLLFKRELIIENPNIYPISFAIPETKIVKSIPEKTKKLADYIPSFDTSKYVYNTEEEYYNNYREAMYGVTHRKSGWDCMRHYEVLGNYCIPLFKDVENIPKMTMVNFPKDLIFRSNQLYESDCDEQHEILAKLHTYTKENLTTRELAKYILNTTSKTL